jgi:hypothetical protein
MNPGVRRQLFVFGAGLVVGGGLLLGYAYREASARQEASATPERIPLARLIERGPERNPHVLVTDFSPCHDFTAIPERNGDRWDAVYVPLVPGKLPPYNRPLPPAPEEVKALVMSRTIKGEQDLRLLRDPKGLRGLVITRVDPPGGEHARALEASYPGIDLSRCIILQEGRGPASAFTVWFAGGLGAVLLLGGVLLLALAAFARRRTPDPPRQGR